MFAEQSETNNRGKKNVGLPYRSASAPAIAEDISQAMLPNYSYDGLQNGSTDYYEKGPSRLNPRMPIQGQNHEFTENQDGDNGVQGILNSLIDNKSNKMSLMQDNFLTGPTSLFSNGLLGANNNNYESQAAGLASIDKALDQTAMSMQSMYISDGTQAQGLPRNAPVRAGVAAQYGVSNQMQYMDANGMGAMGVPSNGQQAYYVQQPVFVDAAGQPIYYARVAGDGQYQQNLMYAPTDQPYVPHIPYNPQMMGPNGPYQYARDAQGNITAYGQMNPNMMRKGMRNGPPMFPNGMRMPYDPMMMAGPNMPRGDEMYMNGGRGKNKDFGRDGRNRNNDYNKNNIVAPPANPMHDPLVDDFRNTYGIIFNCSYFLILLLLTLHYTGKSKQWNLIDLVGHVVAFCQDQHGSRFIQQRLELCNDVDKQIIFDEVIPAAQSLMTDVFGNYVLQKLFEFGNPEQCESLARLLANQCVQLSMQMYGCRVVQKALEYAGTDRLIALVSEFENPPILLRCVHDSNGNHVIQKCIEVTTRAAQDSNTSPEVAEYLNSRIELMIDAFKGRAKDLSSHPYGCRVIQRILEHGSNNQKTTILEELRQYYSELIQDCYGNYVIQFVMQHGWESDRQVLIKEVQSKLLDFSQHKFASNVVERCLQFANKKDKDEMIWTIINATFDLNNPVDAKTGHCVLESMVRDPYANYVVQKVIDVADERQRGAIMRYVKENIVQLRRYTYGKHIIVRLEKITNEKF